MRLLPLLLALSACGGITNKLCGAPGQPCCASSTCDTGALCSAADLCEACGGETQKCCGDSCSGNLSCMSGTCVAALSCTTTCTLGARRCANNGIETCSSTGVCPEWLNTLTTCPSGSLCMNAGSNADCVETCPGACTVDAQLCTNEGLRICVASGACPTLNALTDDTEAPICLTGGSITPELTWESPTPIGQRFIDIAGELRGSYWLLDDLGNIVHYALGPWEYELRPTAGKRMKHLASCGQGSILYAAGEGGTVFHRSGGTWNEESVGSTTLLTDVACDSTRAFASGSDGKVYVRSGSTWTGYATGVNVPFTSVTSLFSLQQIFLGGENGLIVKCEAATLPPTCTTATTNTTVTINALFGDTYTNTVYAVGPNGTLLEGRGGTWTRGNLPNVTGNLVGITAYNDGIASMSTAVAIADNGTAIIRRTDAVQEIVQVPDTGLTAAWVPADDTVIFTGDHGGIWYRNGLFTSRPFFARGGRRPLTQNLTAVTSIGGGRLFAVGENGTRVRRQNGVWSVDALGVTTTQSLRSIAARNAGEIYAVGDGGTVMLRRYGTWVFDAVGLTIENLSSVMLDDTRLWALGESHLFEKNFATGMWRSIALPPAFMPLTMALKKSGGAAQELVVAGDHCATFSFGLTDDSFTAGPPCTMRYLLTSAAFASNGDLLVGTDEGTILKRTGTTMNFENVMGAVRLEPFLGLIADGSTMWAVGTTGALYRRVAGNWSDAAPDVTTVDLTAGAVDDADGLFLVGAHGVVLRRP
ncbi:MAG: hypothetical protein QM817_30240 [Archangium sp.]